MVAAGVGLVVCSAQAKDGNASLKPVLGTWEFHEKAAGGTAGKDVTERLRLTMQVARTCLGGDVWYRAERLASTLRHGMPAAYQYKDGKLAIMLDADICDAYTFYEGEVKRNVFTGKFIDAPWGHAVAGAAVSGRRLP